MPHRRTPNHPATADAPRRAGRVLGSALAAFGLAFAAALRSIWTRFAGRGAAAEALAGLGPNLRKEAGLAPEAGAWMR